MNVDSLTGYGEPTSNHILKEKPLSILQKPSTSNGSSGMVEDLEDPPQFKWEGSSINSSNFFRL